MSLSESIKQKQYQKCLVCTYPYNEINATRCEVCQSSFKYHFVAGSILVFVLIASVGMYFTWVWNKPNTGLIQTKISNFEKLEKSSGNRLEANYTRMKEVPLVPEGLFSYGGSPAFAPLSSQKILHAIASAHPNFNLRYVAPLNARPGSGAGIAMVIDGELSFAQSSRPLSDAEYGKAKQRGFTLEQIPIAIDGIVFFVNPHLSSLPGLSVDQIQGILTGKVKNWQQVGGPSLPVVPYSLDPKVGGSTLSILLKDLPNKKVGDNLQIARNYTDAIRKVATIPGGIGYGSASTVWKQKTIHPLAVAKVNSRQYVPPFINGRVNIAAFQTGTYPLTRYQFIIVRRDRSLAEAAGRAYAQLMLSAQGQDLVEAAGFVPLTKKSTN